MINIVIPMAGRGSRFVKASYELPKPLIQIFGRPMIEYVTKNIAPKTVHRFIYLCLEEHLNKYNLAKKLHQISPSCVIVPVNKVTEGAACTVLLSEQYINNEDQLMIANSDQFVDFDINNYIDKLGDYDGLIMTMPASDPKWSFIKYNNENLVTEVREKEVISNEATVGIYNFKHGSDFVKYAKMMINKNIRVNNEFYVAPVYNEMIANQKRITFFDVGNKMYGLGIPEDLNYFLSLELSKHVFD